MAERFLGRTIAFSVRGFSMPLQDALLVFEATPTRCGAKGDFAKAGATAILKRSFIKFESSVGDDDTWDSILQSIFLKLGGVEKIKKALDSLSPEFVEVSVIVPARYSDQQEDRFLGAESVKMLAILGASFGVGIA